MRHSNLPLKTNGSEYKLLKQRHDSPVCNFDRKMQMLKLKKKRTLKCSLYVELVN